MRPPCPLQGSGAREFLFELPHNATGKVVKHLIGKSPAESDFVEE